jgi:hypothetical protein
MPLARCPQRLRADLPVPVGEISVGSLIDLAKRLDGTDGCAGSCLV